MNKKKNTFFSSRGFNMFSAIVAMILIMTGTVLVNMLITTEEKTSRQIYSTINNYQLADVASVARADALQTFNYNFREKLEDYLTFNQTEMTNGERGFGLFTIRTGDEEFGFEEAKQSFEQSILLVDATEGATFASAIQYVADRTIDQFSSGTYGKFNVYLSDNGPEAKKKLKDLLLVSIERKGENFLEVVGCGEAACPVGTFYFNIPLDQLTDQEYEQLPRIIVKDLVTQEEIKMGILPRTGVKVYIPLRFFKALIEAGEIAKNVINGHDELEEYRLGFCDSCNPRNNPTSPMGGSWTKDCPPSETGSDVILSKTVLGVNTYLAGGPKAGANGLKAFGTETLCNTLISSSSFEVDSSDDSFKVKDSLLVPVDPIELQKDGCGLNKLIIGTASEKEFIIKDMGAVYLYCGKIITADMDVVFEEINPKYMVKGTYNSGMSNLYKLRIQDISYTQVNSQKDVSTLDYCASGINECEAA